MWPSHVDRELVCVAPPRLVALVHPPASISVERWQKKHRILRSIHFSWDISLWETAGKDRGTNKKWHWHAHTHSHVIDQAVKIWDWRNYMRRPASDTIPIEKIFWMRRTGPWDLTSRGFSNRVTTQQFFFLFHLYYYHVTVSIFEILVKNLRSASSPKCDYLCQCANLQTKKKSEFAKN